MDNQEYIAQLEKNGIPKRFINWCVSYLHAGKIDHQTVDITSFYNKSLTYSENKAILKAQFPISNEDLIIKDQASKLQIERANKEANDLYFEDVKKHESDLISKIRTANNTEIMNKYQNTLRVLVRSVVEGYNNSLFIVSEHVGIGKSWAVASELNSLGLKMNESYFIYSGYATPLALYEWLFLHKDADIICLDDCDLSFKNILIISMLKQATYSATGERIVSYITTSKLKTAPDSFILKARIICISNALPNNILIKALIDRSLYLEIKLSISDKKLILTDFAKIEDHGLSYEQRLKAVGFIFSQNTEAMKDLSFRSVQRIYSLMRQFPESEHGLKWQEIAKEIIQYDEVMFAFIESNKELTTKDAILKFEELTGLGRRSFFLYKRKYYNSLLIGKVQSANEHKI